MHGVALDKLYNAGGSVACTNIYNGWGYIKKLYVILCTYQNIFKILFIYTYSENKGFNTLPPCVRPCGGFTLS